MKRFKDVLIISLLTGVAVWMLSCESQHSTTDTKSFLTNSSEVVCKNTE